MNTSFKMKLLCGGTSLITGPKLTVSLSINLEDIQFKMSDEETQQTHKF